MLRFPNAKINIGLFVTDKRADGYHNLETIFYPVKVKEALEIMEPIDNTSSLKISGLNVVGSVENNLIWKAWQMLYEDFFDKVKPLSMYLHKVIPSGAGLGGGSADGAFMLSMVNDFFALRLTASQLENYALQLGSDCPFFIHNKPIFAKGRGEILEAINLNLDDYSIQIICPKLHISTALAFKGIEPKPAVFDLKNMAHLPIENWKNFAKNDFEDSVFSLYPVLSKIKQQLYEQGAIYASLSGTGSTVYGFFEKGKKAEISVDIAFDEFIG